MGSLGCRGLVWLSQSATCVLVVKQAKNRTENVSPIGPLPPLRAHVPDAADACWANDGFSPRTLTTSCNQHQHPLTHAYATHATHDQPRSAARARSHTTLSGGAAMGADATSSAFWACTGPLGPESSSAAAAAFLAAAPRLLNHDLGIGVNVKNPHARSLTHSRGWKMVSEKKGRCSTKTWSTQMHKTRKRNATATEAPHTSENANAKTWKMLRKISNGTPRRT